MSCVMLHATSSSISTSFHSMNLPPDGKSRARPALDVKMHANHGDVSVSHPRCFRGHMTIPTYYDSDERTAFFPALRVCTTFKLLSDVPGSRVYLVGDRPRGGASGMQQNDESETPLVEDELSFSVGGSVRRACGSIGMAMRSRLRCGSMVGCLPSVVQTDFFSSGRIECGCDLSVILSSSPFDYNC